MTKMILLALAFVQVSAQAQTLEGKAAALAPVKEGRVVYEQTRKMGNIRLGGNIPPEMQAQIDAQLAKPRVDQYELLFTPQHSLYQFLPTTASEGGDHTFAGGGQVMVMRGGSANDVSYVDLTSGLRTDQREVMDNSFVVTDTIVRVQWRLTEETKPLLQFTARKAFGSTIVQRPVTTMENGEMKREMRTDTLQVVAWFTTDVPVPVGPNYAGQLPGLILELDINKGQTVIKAIEYSPKVAASKIKPPSSGKKLTAAEFSKEREKLLAEMQKNMPRGNVFRVQ